MRVSGGGPKACDLEQRGNPAVHCTRLVRPAFSYHFHPDCLMPLCVRHSDHLFAQLVNDTKNRPLLTQEPLKRFGLGQRTELAVELELFIGIELLRRMLGRVTIRESLANEYSERPQPPATGS